MMDSDSSDDEYAVASGRLQKSVINLEPHVVVVEKSDTGIS